MMGAAEISCCSRRPITRNKGAFFFVTRFISILLALSLIFVHGAFASPVEDTVLELERSTSFHWGEDCLVWMVHYTQAVVDPWVESEALKANFNEAQKQDYRRAFITELRLDETEPFLVSIYAFGANPLYLKPFEDKITLVESNGQRIKPISYERVFDEPIQGMIQGLVFFPKQPNRNFSIALKGMGVFAERLFGFSGQNAPLIEVSTPPVVREELVVIDMPPPKKQEKEPEPPNYPPIVIEEVPKDKPKEPPKEQPQEKQESQQANDPNAYVSRERTLQTFINSWIANDVTAMYDMLSPENKKMYTKETFASEVKKLADVRRGLLRGYKIEWVGDERAKILTTKKLLIMRTLIGKTVGVVRAGNEWRIVW